MTFLFIHNITLILFTFYCLLEGVREAYYFNAAIQTKDIETYNLHSLFWFQRLIVLLIVISFFAILIQSFLPTIMIGIAYMLMFSFWHNGSYYSMRNNLDPTKYPKRFRAESNSSKALMEFSYKERLFQFLLGFSLHLLISFTYIKLFL